MGELVAQDIEPVEQDRQDGHCVVLAERMSSDNTKEKTACFAPINAVTDCVSFS